MKSFLFLLPLLFCCTAGKSQALLSGRYDELNVAFNPATNIVTAYFESYTGLDEQTGNPRFSCIFYIEGKLNGKTATVTTYYPEDKNDDVIKGTLQLISSNSITIKLPEDHGGCWNVQHFADDPVSFSLSKKEKWIELRYITADKSFFHSDKNEATKRKAYAVKGNVVYIERMENGWAYCSFYGTKTTTTGWLKMETLNKL
ncbi:hypothetical protein ACTHGU_07900 [Chitinophagaceae bacterium MMS25-I14]